VVTGGAGFIGSNLVDRLVDRSAEVLVIDNLSNGTQHNLDAALAAGARLEQLDVRDRSGVQEAMTAFRPTTVFHLAAQIDVRASMTDPVHDAAVNVLGSINVFAAAHATGVSRVINTSTGGAIYGATERIPTPETQPAAPLSAYGLSKRTAEEYGAWFGAAHDVDVVTLRYGNVYGPRQDPRGDAGVIARFCARALTRQPPLIFGDGKQTRDYVYVGDIVEANLAAADAPTLGHRTYNIGTGTEVSVLELIAAVARAAGVDPEVFHPQFEPARPGEVLRSCLDVTRARGDLALNAPTPLELGLARTLDWIRSTQR
jgi:UDP-glucose 4-epimerase